MRQVLLCCLALWVAGSTTRDTSGRAGAPGLDVVNVGDTSEVLVLKDLRILDTIRSPATPNARLPDGSHRLGLDTVVVIDIATFPPQPIRVDQYESGRATPRGMWLQVRVLGRDTVSGRLNVKHLPVSECPLKLDVVKLNSRRGNPAWSSALSEIDSVKCPLTHPNTFDDANATWRVQNILADSLRAGRYDLTASVRLTDGRVLRSHEESVYLTADPSPPITDLSTLVYTASTKITGPGPRTLSTMVVAKNTGQRMTQLSFGSCALQIALFKAANLSSPVWRSQYRQPRKRPGFPHAGYACTMELRVPTLAPGDSQLFKLEIPLAEILADSLPFGTYRVRGTLALGGNKAFDLGDVTVAGVADSLPRSKTVDGIRFTALARIIRDRRGGSGEMVRTMVLITNTRNSAAQLQLARECGVIVYAYKSAADRDSLPSGNVAWRDTRSCAFDMRTFDLKPGERFVAFADKPVAEIPEGLRHGRYYMEAWVPVTSQILLNAGVLDLGK